MSIKNPWDKIPEGGMSTIGKSPRTEYGPRSEKYPEIKIGTMNDVVGLARFSSLKSAGGEAMEEYARLAKGNDESMRIIAAAFNRPNGRKDAINQLIRHKDYSSEEATEFIDRAFTLLADCAPVEILDNAKGVERLQEVRSRIEADICKADEFFRPRPELFGDKKRVIYLPDGPWRKAESGFCVELGEDMLLSVDPDSSINVVHEYLHGYINEITDRAGICPEETERLASLATEKLRQDYGSDSLSLWNEALIRAYRDGLHPKNTPMSLKTFQQQITMIPHERLIDFFERHGLPDQVDDFLKNKTRQAEVFEKYIRDRLLERAWRLLDDYDHAKQGDPTLRFEDYFYSHYRDMLPELDVVVSRISVE